MQSVQSCVQACQAPLTDREDRFITEVIFLCESEGFSKSMPE